MQTLLDKLLEFKYPLLGAAIGGLIAILFFTLGFFKTIFLIGMMVGGAYAAYTWQISQKQRRK